MICALCLLYHVSFGHLLKVLYKHVHKLALDYFFLAFVNSKISFIMFKFDGTKFLDLRKGQRIKLLHEVFEWDSKAWLVQNVVYAISYEVLETLHIDILLIFLKI